MQVAHYKESSTDILIQNLMEFKGNKLYNGVSELNKFNEKYSKRQKFQMFLGFFSRWHGPIEQIGFALKIHMSLTFTTQRSPDVSFSCDASGLVCELIWLCRFCTCRT